MKQQIKICTLNVCGLNARLNDGILEDYIENFDILCVSESKRPKGTDIASYTAFDMTNKIRKYPLPGVHGLHVYISDHIANKCTQILDDRFHSDLVLWVKILDKFILGAAYIPHQNSIYHYSNIFDDIAFDISILKGKYELPFVMAGDFNSRTGLQVGALNDIMILEKQDDTLEEHTYNFPDIVNTLNSLNMPVKRNSNDIAKNDNGKNLMELCKIHDLCVLNGRAGRDKDTGKLTCAGASQIDYIMCTPDLLHRVSDFDVDPFDPALSDKHNPVYVVINLDKNKPNADINERLENQNQNVYNVKSKWDEDKKIEFRLAYDETKINEMLLNICSIDANDVTIASMDNTISVLKDIFLEPAKKTNMHKKQKFKKQRKNIKSDKPWFNLECKESKNKYKRFKNTLKKQPTEAEKELLKKHAKEHRNKLRKERRKFGKMINSQLKLLKSSDPGKYWKIINLKKKKIKIGDIPIETFFNHFRDMNKDNNVSNDSVDEQSVNGNDPQYTNAYIKDIFSIDEIKEHINCLNKKHPPGADYILKLS